MLIGRRQIIQGIPMLAQPDERRREAHYAPVEFDKLVAETWRHGGILTSIIPLALRDNGIDRHRRWPSRLPERKINAGATGGG